MKRRIKRLLLFLFLLLLGLGSWRLAWLTGTTEGAQWILAAVSKYTSVHLTAREVEGKVFGHLVLKGLHLSVAHIEADAERVDLNVSGAFLMLGTVDISSAAFQEVRIQDNTPSSDKPTELAWPRVPWMATQPSVTLGRLQVVGLAYRRLDGPILAVDTLTTSAQWKQGALSLRNLALVSPLGSVDGKLLQADFRKAKLEVDLALTLPKPVADMDRLVLQGHFLPGQGAEQLVGSLVATGNQGSAERLKLSGQVGMTREAFLLRQMALTQPGKEGRVTGDGSLNLATPMPTLVLKLQTTRLDLAPVISLPTDLEGTLSLTGTPDRYLGQVALTNTGKAWRSVRLNSDFQGSITGLKLAPISGSLLGGNVEGNLDLDWREAFALRGWLRARNLNPNRLAPDWAGVVNVDLAGSLNLASNDKNDVKKTARNDAPLRAEVEAKLLDSRLHGRALSGDLRLTMADDRLQIGSLNLVGQGFSIKASGEVDQRLSLAADISDLSRLIPEAAGKVRADGWMRWRKGVLSGNLDGMVRDLAMSGVGIASGELAAHLEEGKNAPLAVSTKLRKVEAAGFRADEVKLDANGTVLHHTVKAASTSARGEMHLEVEGGYGKDEWSGTIRQFSVQSLQGTIKLEAPTQVRFGAKTLSMQNLTLLGASSERITAEADLGLMPLRGSAKLAWVGLDLARANPWLKNVQLVGSSQGSLAVGFPPDNQLTVKGSASAAGTLTGKEMKVTVARSEFHLDGGEQGMTARLALALSDGAELNGQFQSATPAALSIPGEGRVALEWKGFDPGLAQPWLPMALHLKGRLGGWTKGELGPGNALSLKGEASLTQGDALWQGPDGQIKSVLKKAVASWTWQGESLQGNVEVELTERGQARGSFQIPLPARIPTALDAKGPLQVSVTAAMQEKGLMTMLLPGLVQESQGDLDAQLNIRGSWEAPQIEGEVKLAKAGAYLPSAGIRLRDIEVKALLGNDFIRVEGFKANSGEGHLAGTAKLYLQGWQVARYEGTLSGERFQTVFFPELEIQTSPHLTFEGTLEKLAVRGDISIPTLQLLGTQAKSTVGPSKDVILVEDKPKLEKASTLALDVQLRLVLGDKVQIKMSGIEVQLGGSLDLKFQDLNKIASKGEIRVIKGRYKAYGVNLDIARGRIFYAGGPLDQPNLDFLALRTINEVKAGVTVSGTLQEPVSRLYSDPVLPDLDVVGYLVLGHPVSTGEQAGAAAIAAGALFSSSNLGGAMQDEIESRFGLQTMGVETNTRQSGGTSGAMGYTPLPTSASGSQSAGVTEAMLTVGKYITPKLYTSYARSLVSSSYIFRLRYDMSKRWQVESQTGDESGLDLYYKIEFK